MIRPTHRYAALQKPRPEADAFNPDLLFVKFKEDVVPLRPDLTLRAAARPRPDVSLDLDALLPAAVGTPLTHLLDSGQLRDVTPLFPDVRKPKKIPAGHALALSVTRSVLETPAPDLAGINVVTVADPATLPQLERIIQGTPGVEYCHRVPRRWLAGRKAKSTSATTTDPFVNRQWALRAIRWFQAQPLPDARAIKVAVLDSGVDASHPDLPTIAYDHTGFTAVDIVGHGTHVAGIIAAQTNNEIGIAGVTPCDLHVWKVFGDGMDEDDEQYYREVDDIAYHRALNKARQAGVRVVNLSLGGYTRGKTEELLIQKLVASGAVVVAAMGNEFLVGNPVEYPAAYEGVIAVGATTEANRRAEFSNTGIHIALSAPGANILSTLPLKKGKGRPDTEYAAWDGTSMATPYVAAAAALVLAQEPSLTPEEVRAHLRKTAMRLDAAQRAVGTGLLNLQAALAPSR